MTQILNMINFLSGGESKKEDKRSSLNNVDCRAIYFRCATTTTKVYGKDDDDDDNEEWPDYDEYIFIFYDTKIRIIIL